eukprot:TRINITY_DN12752_c0_g2_i1.p1 TRINITY_DN12752_c0_g2~~TRINITY_DN12752_c0_g2_i1.p1  ORF type:complete len:383 (-),score=96.72 TRINITY_DN12752_c0_g2_i1:54-1202(-)
MSDDDFEVQRPNDLDIREDVDENEADIDRFQAKTKPKSSRPQSAAHKRTSSPGAPKRAQSARVSREKPNVAGGRVRPQSSTSPHRPGQEEAPARVLQPEEIESIVKRLSKPKALNPHKQISASISDCAECTFSPKLSKAAQDMKEPGPPSIEKIVTRLAQPRPKSPSKDISSSISDCAECKFVPEVSEVAKNFQAPPLMNRITQQIERFKKSRQELKEPPLSSEYTFTPALNPDDEYLKKLSEVPFLERVKKDLKQRESSHVENVKKYYPEFIRNGGQKNDQKGFEEFMERYQRDLQQRRQKLDEMLSMMSRPDEQLTFRPTLSQATQDLKLEDFLDRMNADIDERTRRARKNAKKTTYVDPNNPDSQPKKKKKKKKKQSRS